MPWIEKHLRPPIDEHIDACDVGSWSQGELTYAIYRLMWRWANQLPRSYTNMSMTVATAEDAAFEFRRVELAPYEHKKMQRNGGME